MEWQQSYLEAIGVPRWVPREIDLPESKSVNDIEKLEVSKVCMETMAKSGLSGQSLSN